MRFVVVLVLLCRAAHASGPALISPSAIAIDATSGDVLFERRADEVRPIASLTKLFAAIVLRANKLVLARSTTITHDDVVASIGGAPTILRRGQRFNNADLLYAMLLSSDNRTPTALARSIGLSSDELLLAMRKRAADLGLASTRLDDVTGLAGNASTARDMALALREAIRDPVLRRFMTTKRVRVVSEDGSVSGDYTSTVPPLWSKHVILGGKTGWTEDAGYCEVIAVQLGNRKIVMAFLGARDKVARYDDFIAVADWLTSSLPAGPDRAPGSPRRASASR